MVAVAVAVVVVVAVVVAVVVGVGVGVAVAVGVGVVVVVVVVVGVGVVVGVFPMTWTPEKRAAAAAIIKRRDENLARLKAQQLPDQPMQWEIEAKRREDLKAALLRITELEQMLDDLQDELAALKAKAKAKRNGGKHARVRSRK